MRARPTASSYQPLTGRRRSVRWPSYFQPPEHLLRYCARPPFALERLSVMRGEDGRIACVRSVAGHAACGDATADCCDSCDKPPEPPPVSPARGPPTDWGELVQVHDDRAIFQGRIDELPDIDIHSL